MNIAEILALKFPYANFRKDIKLADNGDGVLYIHEWNLNETPKPDQKTLDAWAVEVDLLHRQKLARKARVYPKVEDQLDMQYHDAINGTSTWVDLIKSIKEKHPIPA